MHTSIKPLQLFALSGLAAALMLPACQRGEPIAQDRPTNADFQSIRAKRGPASLVAPVQPNDLDQETKRRIAESVDLLDSYFSQQQTAQANAADRNNQGYDPSAEFGPTGTGTRVTPNTAPPAMVATANDTNGVESNNNSDAASRLLEGFDLVELDQPIDNAASTPEVTSPQVVISTRVISPGALQIGPPTGAGLVVASDKTFEDDFDAFLNEFAGTDVDLGPAVASADGSLPVVPQEFDAIERKQELVEELVGVLTELANDGEDPYRTGLALAGLESLSPGALYELVDQGVLLPHETEILISAHEFLQGLAANSGSGDPELAMDLVDTVRERLNESAPLRISAAELCTRVWGYGQYETFDREVDGAYRFVAGRRQPIIIYTEVDRFGRRPIVDEQGVSQWQVELSQELQIFHVSDDLLVTSRSAETDTSLSRAKMRDYYLINQTELPADLTMGKYHLKIIMRDANKDAVAESIIPFEIVAGSSLDGQR